jgi:hypothetical protein
MSNIFGNADLDLFNRLADGNAELAGALIAWMFDREAVTRVAYQWRSEAAANRNTRSLGTVIMLDRIADQLVATVTRCAHSAHRVAVLLDARDDRREDAIADQLAHAREAAWYEARG